MKLNDKSIIENYKTIHKTCLEDGYLLPSLLSPVIIPFKHRLTYEELQSINIKTDELNRRIADRRAIEETICKSECDVFDSIPEYWEYEMEKFFNKYPQFKTMIIEEE